MKNRGYLRRLRLAWRPVQASRVRRAAEPIRWAGSSARRPRASDKAAGGPSMPTCGWPTPHLARAVLFIQLRSELQPPVACGECVQSRSALEHPKGDHAPFAPRPTLRTLQLRPAATLRGPRQAQPEGRWGPDRGLHRVSLLDTPGPSLLHPSVRLYAFNSVAQIGRLRHFPRVSKPAAVAPPKWVLIQDSILTQIPRPVASSPPPERLW